MIYNKKEMLEGVVDVNFWRAPTDNDFGAFKISKSSKLISFISWGKFWL